MTDTSNEFDLFAKPKTATDLLTDLIRHSMITEAKERALSKSNLTKRWSGHQWSNPELAAWARWQYREMVK